MSKEDFPQIFQQLKTILEPYAQTLNITHNNDKVYYLDTNHTMNNKKPLFFGSVTAKKSYVSFHLMPIYIQPELLNNMSDALKKRMQGKSCFNFKKTDQALFQELADLTAKGYKSYQDANYIPRD